MYINRHKIIACISISCSLPIKCGKVPINKPQNILRLIYQIPNVLVMAWTEF